MREVSDREKLQKIYEKIEENHYGKRSISTYYARKVANLLGGDYDTLPALKKIFLRDDIIFERVSLEKGISVYF